VLTFLSAAQLIVGLSVAFVWIFRFDNIIRDFKQFGLSDLTRSAVGASKIAVATLLVAGIWFHSLILIPAALMGMFMLVAQYFHNKINNPMIKRLPSLVLFLLSLFIVLVSLNYISI